MFKKITCFVFAFILVFTNATPISAVKLETNILNKNIEFVTINGKEYKFTQYLIGDTNYLIRENDNKVDVFKYDMSENLVTMNGEIFGTMTTTLVSNSYNISTQAARPVCAYSPLNNVYDEQGNVAVYEGCTTYQIAVGTGMDDAISGVAVIIMIAGVNIKTALKGFWGGKVLPAVLDSILSTERQQFRSKNLILNPYSGLNQYKRLFASYYFIGGSRFYGPVKSVWWF